MTDDVGTIIISDIQDQLIAIERARSVLQVATEQLKGEGYVYIDAELIRNLVFAAGDLLFEAHKATEKSVDLFFAMRRENKAAKEMA